MLPPTADMLRIMTTETALSCARDLHNVASSIAKLAVAAAVLKVKMQNHTMCFASCVLKKSSAQTNMTVI